MNKSDLKKQIDKGMTLREIADYYGYSSQSTVRNWLQKYGINKRKRLSKTWTQDEMNWLIDNYWKLGGKKCATYLKRSENSIWRKACQLKLEYGKFKTINPPESRVGKDNKQWKGCEELSGSYWFNIVSGAKKRNIKFDISIEDAWMLYENQNKKCALSGMNIEFGKMRHNKSTASLDRIDSSKGYTIDNIQWLHKDINKMKWDFSQEKFLELCKKIVNNLGD